MVMRMVAAILIQAGVWSTHTMTATMFHAAGKPTK